MVFGDLGLSIDAMRERRAPSAHTLALSPGYTFLAWSAAASPLASTEGLQAPYAQMRASALPHTAVAPLCTVPRICIASAAPGHHSRTHRALHPGFGQTLPRPQLLLPPGSGQCRTFQVRLPASRSWCRAANAFEASGARQALHLLWPTTRGYKGPGVVLQYRTFVPPPATPFHHQRPARAMPQWSFTRTRTSVCNYKTLSSLNIKRPSLSPSYSVSRPAPCRAHAHTEPALAQIHPSHAASTSRLFEFSHRESVNDAFAPWASSVLAEHCPTQVPRGPKPAFVPLPEVDMDGQRPAPAPTRIDSEPDVVSLGAFLPSFGGCLGLDVRAPAAPLDALTPELDGLAPPFLVPTRPLSKTSGAGAGIAPAAQQLAFRRPAHGAATGVLVREKMAVGRRLGSGLLRGWCAFGGVPIAFVA
jgi:hypothetical protein